jgi:hypothetical protein
MSSDLSLSIMVFVMQSQLPVAFEIDLDCFKLFICESIFLLHEKMYISIWLKDYTWILSVKKEYIPVNWSIKLEELNC